MIDHFDEAFESAYNLFFCSCKASLIASLGRIHFSILYPDLDFESRKKIWKMFFAKVMKNASEISKEDLDRLANRKMNGRQVRNLLSWLYPQIADAIDRSRMQSVVRSV